MPAGQTISVAPLWVGRDGVAALWTDWERFSFAHPGASVAKFLNASSARSISTVTDDILVREDTISLL